MHLEVIGRFMKTHIHESEGFRVDLSKILNKMKAHEPSLYDHELKHFGIMIPLIEVDGQPHLLFQIRAQHLRSQPGDVCFPGGGVEPQDRSEMETAIRETMEELNVKREEIDDVYPLNIVMQTTERMIHTFVGRLKPEEAIIPNPEEVEEIFTVPLAYFIDNKPDLYPVYLQAAPAEDFPLHLIVGGEDYSWPQMRMDEHFYVYEDKVIWGLTAKIIRQFLDVIR